ncbi:MAG: xanthine dehydrogenase accessory protein XdhC [Cytophaga sp.]|nr:xanthine dehydrogenase accessory protein XdhC [Undibacterium sp.]
MTHHWLNALATLTTPAILVTVAKVLGSGPRTAGAKMLVTQEQSFDTIGGGHLEMCAIDIARKMLEMPAGTLARERHLQNFSLGPSLGQCCGGSMHLAFEGITQHNVEYTNQLQQRWRSRQDSWRFTSLETLSAATIVDASGGRLTGPNLPTQLVSQIDLTTPCQLVKDESDLTWLVDLCAPYKPHLMLFGAGHVGAAIVRALADLPCQITWVDEREDMFPANLPPNVKIEATDTPVALIARAPPDVSFLVLTHSHALDQQLTEHILRRDDFAWFGLIGSKTKRMLFEHRLRGRGINDVQLEKMVCPIGIPGIQGKEPAVIATSVAAQLLQVWEAYEKSSKSTASTPIQKDALEKCH